MFVLLNIGTNHVTDVIQYAVGVNILYAIFKTISREFFVCF
jgi:glycopeptide antibiotics resistance protein